MRLPPPTVILGAGNLGRRVAHIITPTVFCDNNPLLWGNCIDAIPVIPPADAVKQFPDATFVVAIWNPSRTETMVDRIAKLQELGARKVVPFTALIPEYRDQLLPHLFWTTQEFYPKHEGNIARARNLLDTAGRKEFDRQMQLRMGDFAGQVIDPDSQYFPSDLFSLSDNEVFIDCGAYDGDTLLEFRRVSENRFAQYVAFEPDPANFSALKSAVNGDDRVRLQPYAVGARRETLRFSATGTGSHISEDGTWEVQSISLDEALGDIEPTYIKFDIEGSELDALEGARQTIARHRPKLAVCAYHRPDDLWRIPIRLNELLPDFRLTLRTYNADGLDCVCYCIPE